MKGAIIVVGSIIVMFGTGIEGSIGDGFRAIYLLGTFLGLLLFAIAIGISLWDRRPREPAAPAREPEHEPWYAEELKRRGQPPMKGLR